MKKCPDCEREIDKYGIACEYCDKLRKEQEKVEISEKKKSE